VQEQIFYYEEIDAPFPHPIKGSIQFLEKRVVKDEKMAKILFGEQLDESPGKKIVAVGYHKGAFWPSITFQTHFEDGTYGLFFCDPQLVNKKLKEFNEQSNHS
jgi:hypothetical protein